MFSFGLRVVAENPETGRPPAIAYDAQSEAEARALTFAVRQVGDQTGWSLFHDVDAGKTSDFVGTHYWVVEDRNVSQSDIAEQLPSIAQVASERLTASR